MAASSLFEQFDQAYAGGGKGVLAFWNATLPAATAEPGKALSHHALQCASDRPLVAPDRTPLAISPGPCASAAGARRSTCQVL